jgi:hypothetical protein
VQPTLANKPEEKKRLGRISSSSPGKNHLGPGQLGAPTGLPLFLSHHLQAKLTVGAPNDPLEREADHVAAQVMRSVDGGTGLNAASQMSAPVVHRHTNGDGKCAGTAEAPPIVHQALRSPGQPLDASVRLMESRFGRDFSDVRIHTDSLAAQSAQAVNALAYTAGNHVVFAPGQYSPGSSEGTTLLAHELTHVVQQSHTGKPLIQRQPSPQSPDQQPPQTAQPEVEQEVVFAEGMGDEEYTAITGMPADTLPEGLFVKDLDALAATVANAPPGTLPPGVGFHAEEASDQPGAVAAGVAAIGAPSPISLIPRNATGIMWIQGHVSVFAKVEGELTIRGFRGGLHLYALEMIPGPWGEYFSRRLNLDVTGSFKNDVLFAKVIPGVQTVIYVPTDPETADDFRDQLTETQYNEKYRYSPPRPNKSVGGDTEVTAKERRMYEYLVSKTGETRAVVCRRNCTTVPADQFVEAIGMHPQVDTPAGRLDIVTGRTEGGDPNPYEAGRSSRMRQFMAKPDLSAARPGATRIGMTKGAAKLLGAIRIGGGIWMVYGAVESVEHLVDAWRKGEFGTALIQEAGTWGGGIAFGELGSAISEGIGEDLLPLFGGEETFAFVAAEGGVIFLLGYLGAKAGGAIAEAAINAIPALLYVTTLLLGGTMEVIERSGKSLRHGMTGVFIRPIVVMRESINPANWDLRHMPPTAANDIRRLGQTVYSKLSTTSLDDFRDEALKTFAGLGVSQNLAAQISQDLTAAGVPMIPEELLALRPKDLVQLLNALKLLYFVKDPDTSADNQVYEEGHQANEMMLNVRLGPLVAKRASINPNNWDLSAIAPDADDIRDLGLVFWEKLRRLDSQDFDQECEKPLSKLGVTQEMALAAANEMVKPIAFGVGEMRHEQAPPEMVSAYAKGLLEMTPDEFVQRLQETAHLHFRQDPGAIASAAVQWMRAGYQPW